MESNAAVNTRTGAGPITGRTAGWVVWVGRVLSALTVLTLLMGVIMAFRHSPDVVQGVVQHYGYPESAVATIGVLELLCAVLYAVPRTAVFGALLMTGYLGGAVATHVRVGEFPAAPIIMAIVAWIGLYLRDARLRALVPFRS